MEKLREAIMEQGGGCETADLNAAAAQPPVAGGEPAADDEPALPDLSVSHMSSLTMGFEADDSDDVDVSAADASAGAARARAPGGAHGAPRAPGEVDPGGGLTL